MMEFDLTLRMMIERANKLYPNKEIVTRDYAGDFRYTYADFYQRTKRLANSLGSLGVARGERVGALCWNHHRHLELYFGVPTTGAVLHTLNLRLTPEQLVYIINHAEDKVLFVDKDLLPLAEGLAPHLKTVEHFVVVSDTKEIPETTLSPVSSYEVMLEQASPDYEFPTDISEWAPAAMCYTTATTGNPKGVVYTHRGLVLHSYAAALPDALCLAEKDVTLPFVPMFHANAWGLPFVSTWLGCKQVFPGARPQPEDLCRIIAQEKVTLAAGVPTIWMGTLEVWKAGKYDISSIRALVVGGSAAPRPMVKTYLEQFNIPIIHAYGMTETTPVVLVSRPKSYLADSDIETLLDLNAKQGLVVPGLDIKVVRDEDQEVPWDGKTMGELLVRGPWIAKEYYKDPERSKPAFKDGWLHTGDIVTIDPEGYVAIADRSKDLIKSGGEWISSLDLENTIMGHPAVAEACVIGVPDPKWQERPLACVVLRPEYKDKVTEKEILDFLDGKVARFWIPDRVIFMDEVPKTSVGKFNKKALREKLS